MQVVSDFLLFAVLTLASVACAAHAGRVEFAFVGGARLCVDEAQKVEGNLSSDFGAAGKLTAISLAVDATRVDLAPDVTFNEAYYRDLAEFIESHPANVSLDSATGIYSLDVRMRPPAEVNSMRLIDRLIPGDGSMAILVSKAVRESRDNAQLGEARLAEILIAMCWSASGESRRCERRFPFHGFRASYSLPPDGSIAAAKDTAIRQRLSGLAGPCP